MARLLAGVVAPSLADDQQFLQFIAKAMRSSVSPGAAQAWLRMISSRSVPRQPDLAALTRRSYQQTLGRLERDLGADHPDPSADCPCLRT